MFDSSTYIKRRAVLKNQLKSIYNSSGIALFIGHDESPVNFADNCYHFRQDSTFLYFFGHNKPSLAGVIDIDEGIDYLFGDDAGIDELVWTGYQTPVKELGGKVGITNTGNLAELELFLKKANSQKRKIHILPPYRAETKLKLLKLSGLNIVNINSDEFLINSSGELVINTSIELIKSVIAQREIKTDEEIEQIEEAVNISVDMHIEAVKAAESGMREHQVVAAIYKKIYDKEVSMAFTPIATVRGETLHNHFYGNILKKGDLFLLDAGVENKMHYASDLSTTFPVESKFTSMQKEIYQITLNAHKAAIAALCPEIPFKDVHLRACKMITSGLKELGLMKGDVDEAVQSGAYALFFPCGTGHMMGLDVHDMEDLGEIYVGYNGEPKSTQFGLKSLRLAKPLKCGFVLTIEPGIYFIPALIDKWRAENKFLDFINYNKLEQYRTFGGIRNEEDYLITKTGAELIGKPKPKEIE